MSHLWYNSFSVGPFIFTVEFEKVNPLTNRLNYATSRVYLNGKLGHTWWYGTKSEARAQIEIAQKIDDFLESFNYIHLNKDEMEYLFDESGQFSKLSHLFDFPSSSSLESYIDSRKFRRTIYEYQDRYCLIGEDPTKIFFNIKVDYDPKKDKLDISYTDLINDRFNNGSKSINVPHSFSRCLTIAIIIKILFDFSKGIIERYHIVDQPRLSSLISIPSNISACFGVQYQYYKECIEKYEIFEY